MVAIARVFFLSIFVILSMSAITVYAETPQDTTQAAAQTAVATVKDQVEEAMQSEELSIYGEIQSVDTQNTGTLTVQYYDYDTDDEKTISINIDAGTKLENAQTPADIKSGDWADITYAVSGGKNTAKSVIVEKEEVVTPNEASEGAQAAAKEETAVVEDMPY